MSGDRSVLPGIFLGALVVVIAAITAVCLVVAIVAAAVICSPLWVPFTVGAAVKHHRTVSPAAARAALTGRDGAL